MTTPASPRTDLLSEMLLELIEILRDRQGDTWAAIARIASGKSATIAIDGTRIYVQVEGEQDLQITISDAKPDAINDFEGKVLRTSLSKEDEAKLQAVLTKA